LLRCDADEAEEDDDDDAAPTGAKERVVMKKKKSTSSLNQEELCYVNYFQGVGATKGSRRQKFQTDSNRNTRTANSVCSRRQKKRLKHRLVLAVCLHETR
jgi:hypothetical protein